MTGQFGCQTSGKLGNKVKPVVKLHPKIRSLGATMIRFHRVQHAASPAQTRAPLEGQTKSFESRPKAWRWAVLHGDWSVGPKEEHEDMPNCSMLSMLDLGKSCEFNLFQTLQGRSGQLVSKNYRIHAENASQQLAQWQKTNRHATP